MPVEVIAIRGFPGVADQRRSDGGDVRLKIVLVRADGARGRRRDWLWDVVVAVLVPVQHIGHRVAGWGGPSTGPGGAGSRGVQSRSCRPLRKRHAESTQGFLDGKWAAQVT